MVKLTPELIEQCAQYTNAVRDRELDLRGYKIPVIENMGATLDQFDTIDMSDNDIRKVDGFPLLRRLKTILFNNNRIVRIGEHIEESLPYIETLILTNNGLQELCDIDNLATVKTLRTLSLMRNPITTKKHYRLYVIHKIPHLRLLDFQKIKQHERETASKLFKGKKGLQLARDVSRPKNRTFVPGAALANKASGAPASSGPPKQDVEAIRLAIANAKTLEEVEQLNKMLQMGQIPGRDPPPGLNENGHAQEEEMDT